MNKVDLLITEVLPNKTKTKAYLKRLKAHQPDKWARVYGNVSRSYMELQPQNTRVKRYSIGVFDPDIDTNWPWHYHYEDGIYLSAKYRRCKQGKAKLFENAGEAREFFHSWKGKKNYKMELIEFETTITV